MVGCELLSPRPKITFSATEHHLPLTFGHQTDNIYQLRIITDFLQFN